MLAQLRPAPRLGQRQGALPSSQQGGHGPRQPRRLRLAPRAQQLQEPPPAPAKPPEPPANGANDSAPTKLPELPFTEVDIAALRATAPPAPTRPAAAKKGGAAGKKGSSRPLTELDMMVIRGRDVDAPKITWPQKNSFIAVAWDQLMDSGADIYSHVRRGIKELPSTKAFDKLVGIGSTLRLQADKPVVLLLGSGWGAHSIMKVIDVDQYEVVCVSPRNHFLFTPMLPSTAVGTVEFRSLLEPVRVANPFVDYFEASCDKIDLDNKVAYCTSKNAYKDGRLPKFEVPYDILIVSVGEQPATFGTPGVEENCFFMKEIPDSVGLRQRIQNQFELAALPGTTEDDMSTALNFVVVGGGPTGVEFAGTLSDFLREDLKKKYPELMPFVKVTLLNSAQSILTQFDSRMQQHAIDNFKRVGVNVMTGVRVTGVTRDTITLKDGSEIKYGLCVWSAGNAPRPLVQQLSAQIPEQAQYQPGERPSKLAVDPFLRVIGARDVLAIGDCSLMVGDRLPATAQVAGQQGAYVAHLINRGFLPLQGGMDQPPPCKPISTTDALMEPMRDATMGDDEGQAVIYYKKPFNFLNLGALAYLGGDSALTEINLPFTNIKLSGQLAYLVWKSVYITKQVSFRNRVLILFDWLKAQVFGRDLSNF